MHTHTRLSILSLLLTSAASLSAQTSAPPARHAATTPATTAAAPAGCAKNVPVLSPKIPALPAGSPCPKVLFTITTTPTVKLDYVSPMAGPGLRTTLGIESSSFSELYVDTKVGAGELAQPHKWYTIHYTGYLTDGTKFDSSLGKEPISINYGQHMVIPGWDTGFDGMHIGGKRRIYIPYELAYGPNGKPPTIPAKSELIFDVELVAQSDARPEPKAPPAPAAQPAPGGAAKPAATPPSDPNPAPKPAAPATTPNPTPKQ